MADPGPRSVGWLDVSLDMSKVNALVDGLNDIGRNAGDRVFARALNRVGDMAYTQVVRNLVAEVGAADQKRVREAITKTQALGTTKPYVITGAGGYLPLDAFAVRRTSEGISAAPWGHRRTFRGTFYGPGGRVYKREGKGRLPIKQLYGPSIAQEMVRGKTGNIVNDVFRANWVDRVSHEAEFEVARINQRLKAKG